MVELDGGYCLKFKEFLVNFGNCEEKGKFCEEVVWGYVVGWSVGIVWILLDDGWCIILGVRVKVEVFMMFFVVNLGVYVIIIGVGRFLDFIVWICGGF